MPVKETWNLERISLSKLLVILDSKKKCTGITTNPDLSDRRKDTSQMFTFIATDVLDDGTATTTAVTRSRNCAGAVDEGRCRSCQALYDQLVQKQPCEAKKIHPKTPLSTLSRVSLIKEVKDGRQKLKHLDALVTKMKAEVSRKGVELNSDLTEGLSSVLNQDQHFANNELLQLFWSEQKKALSRSPKGMRWHPMMIRFAIYLHYQSPRCYEALRDTGVLHLPNKSTLRDYTNVVQPKSGFQPEVFQVDV